MSHIFATILEKDKTNPLEKFIVTDNNETRSFT
jgi:hypothetical protein